MAGFIYTKEATQVSVMRRIEQQSLISSWLIAGRKDTEAGRQTVFAPLDYQRIPTPRLHPKVVLKNAWQVQHDKEVQQPRTRVLRETTLKIDLRVQAVPQNAALEDQGRMTKIQILVHTLRTQSRTESVIVD